MGVDSFPGKAGKVPCSTRDLGRFLAELGGPGQGGKLLEKSFEKASVPGDFMSVHAWRLARLMLPLHRSHRLVPTPSKRSPGWGQKLRTLGLTPQQESPHLSPLTTAVLGGSALGAGQGISAGCEEGELGRQGEGVPGAQ